MKRYAVLLLLMWFALCPDTVRAQVCAADTCCEAACKGTMCGADSCGASQWTGGSFAGLHPGLNARFEFSLVAGLGRGSRRGAGFGQSVALDYALPLGKRGFLALGVYADHMKWGNDRRTDAGIRALLGYRAADWLNVYVFAQKGIVDNASATRACDPFYYSTPYDRPKDEIGAAFEFKLHENASITLSVSHLNYGNSSQRDVFAKPQSGLRPYGGANW